MVKEGENKVPVASGTDGRAKQHQPNGIVNLTHPHPHLTRPLGSQKPLHSADGCVAASGKSAPAGGPRVCGSGAKGSVHLALLRSIKHTA